MKAKISLKRSSKSERHVERFRVTFRVDWGWAFSDRGTWLRSTFHVTMVCAEDMKLL